MPSQTFNAVSQLCTVVSWDGSSASVSHWEVQRASANKLFAAKIRSVDSTTARSLDYTTVATVTPEASRASGIAADGGRDLDRTVYVGGRFYLDSNVSPNNSYFYRTRTVGVDGSVSAWVYAGIHFNDYAQDRKFISTLSDDQKVSLVSDPRPILPVIVPGPLITQVTQVQTIPAPTPLKIDVTKTQQDAQNNVNLLPAAPAPKVDPVLAKSRTSF